MRMTEKDLPATHPTCEVLGVPVSLLDMDGTVAALERMIGVGRPHLVVTADASGLALAQTDPQLLALYRSADLATADSQGVLWALRRRGHRLHGCVSGVVLADRLIQLSSEKGYRVFLLGAAPGVAEEAAEKMRLRHPGCNIVGTRDGFFTPDDDILVAEEVAKTHPDILLVAMGIPRQEKFIARTMGTIGAKVALGVGGTFDVFSGRVRRAPGIIQKLKLEWLWRLLLNPRKIGKVKMLPRFVSYVLKEGR